MIAALAVAVGKKRHYTLYMTYTLYIVHVNIIHWSIDAHERVLLLLLLEWESLMNENIPIITHELYGENGARIK